MKQSPILAGSLVINGNFRFPFVGLRGWKKLFFALTLGTMLNSCSTGFSGSKKPEPRSGIKDPNKSPEESNAPNSPDGPTIETKTLTFALQPAQPDSWWNNCVIVIFNGKTVDLGCSKTEGGLKSVKMEVDKETTCGVINFEIKTFKNKGDTCKKNFAKKIACTGPYETDADLVRKTSVQSDQSHFKWSQSADTNESTLKFEDQPTANIASYEKDKSKAEALGIDFNDVTLSVQAPGIAVKLLKSATGGSSDEQSGCN